MQVLKNILTFALTAGQTTAVTHGMNINGVSLTPRVVQMDGGGFGVTADATNITVSRGANAQSTVKALLELWHSIEDAEPLPGGIATSLYPMIVQGAGTQGDAGIAIAAGTQTASNGTVVLASSNGASFGMSNSSQITGRVASVIGTGNENLAITASGSGNVVMAATGGSVNVTGLHITGSAISDMTLIGGRSVGLSAGTVLTMTGGSVMIEGNSLVNIGANSTISMRAPRVTIGGDNQLSMYGGSSGVVLLAQSSNVAISAPATNGHFAVSVGSQVQLLAGTGADLAIDNVNGVNVQAVSNGKLGFYGVAAITRAALSSSSDLTAWVSRIATLLNALGLASTV